MRHLGFCCGNGRFILGLDHLKCLFHLSDSMSYNSVILCYMILRSELFVAIVLYSGFQFILYTTTFYTQLLCLPLTKQSATAAQARIYTASQKSRSARLDTQFVLWLSMEMTCTHGKLSAWISGSEPKEQHAEKPLLHV